MPLYNSREPRQPVSIGGRFNIGGGWRDLHIRNISPRGIMAACADPPTRGDYVELRCGPQVIVARVVWVRDGRFGARTQDKIDLSALTGGSQPSAGEMPERRWRMRAPKSAPQQLSLAARFAASRQFSRLFDFASLAIVGAVLAAVAAAAAYEALSSSLGRVGTALAGN